MTRSATSSSANPPHPVWRTHLDMVPQNNNDVQHDWEKDPVETYIDGEWVKAKGTTLGADNGIGCAVAMAILESKDIAHGPVEALFTIDEETGMTGAQALKGGRATSSSTWTPRPRASCTWAAQADSTPTPSSASSLRM